MRNGTIEKWLKHFGASKENEIKGADSIRIIIFAVISNNRVEKIVN